MALVVVAGGIAALLLIGLGIWFQISCLGRLAEADHTRGPAEASVGGHRRQFLEAFTDEVRGSALATVAGGPAARPPHRRPHGHRHPFVLGGRRHESRVAFDADERVASMFILNRTRREPLLCRQRIDHQEKQMSVNSAACDDGRIRCDDQELIIGNNHLAACAGLRTSTGKHLGLSPASTAAVSPSRWQGSGKLAQPGQAR